MSLIHIENLSKPFKIRNHREGVGSAFCFALTYVIPSFADLLRPEDISPLI